MKRSNRLKSFDKKTDEGHKAWLEKKEYTFTCVECNEIKPISEGSSMVKFTCRNCAIKEVLE